MHRIENSSVCCAFSVHYVHVEYLTKHSHVSLKPLFMSPVNDKKKHVQGAFNVILNFIQCISIQTHTPLRWKKKIYSLQGQIQILLWVFAESLHSFKKEDFSIFDSLQAFHRGWLRQHNTEQSFLTDTSLSWKKVFFINTANKKSTKSFSSPFKP